MPDTVQKFIDRLKDHQRELQYTRKAMLLTPNQTMSLGGHFQMSTDEVLFDLAWINPALIPAALSPLKQSVDTNLQKQILSNLTSPVSVLSPIGPDLSKLLSVSNLNHGPPDDLAKILAAINLQQGGNTTLSALPFFNAISQTQTAQSDLLSKLVREVNQSNSKLDDNMEKQAPARQDEPRFQNKLGPDGRPVCNFCSKPGHLYKVCRSRLIKSQLYQGRPNSNYPNQNQNQNQSFLMQNRFAQPFTSQPNIMYVYAAPALPIRTPLAIQAPPQAVPATPQFLITNDPAYLQPNRMPENCQATVNSR